MVQIVARKVARAKQSFAWSPEETDRLRHLWGVHRGRIPTIAKEMGRTKGSIDGKSRTMGLQFMNNRAIVLDHSSAAAANAESLFHRRRVVMPDKTGVLKWGDNQRKLGGRVTKGAWKHMPIYSLTLEERASCPETCKMWFACYGNNMGHAKRYRHGEELLIQLADDLDALNRAYPDGFVVRLHILGDFWSADYVKFWDVALHTFDGLRVFGYTAWPRDSEIGSAIHRLRTKMWDRFAVRTSGAKSGPRTMVVDGGQCTSMYMRDNPILCPVQEGRTKNCGTCGLCWAPAAKDRPIAFHQH